MMATVLLLAARPAAAQTPAATSGDKAGAGAPLYDVPRAARPAPPESGAAPVARPGSTSRGSAVEAVVPVKEKQSPLPQAGPNSNPYGRGHTAGAHKGPGELPTDKLARDDVLVRGLLALNPQLLADLKLDVVDVRRMMDEREQETLLQILNSNPSAFRIADLLTERLTNWRRLYPGDRVVGFQGGTLYVMRGHRP